MKKLFVAYTPLHLVIIKSIIDHNDFPQTSIVVLCVCEDRERMIKVAKRYLNDIEVVFICRSNTLRTLHSLYLKLRDIKNQNSSSLEFYTGNLKIIFSRFVLAVLNEQVTVINSFDDGYGNLFSTGYLKSNDVGLKKILIKLFWPNCTYNNLLKKLVTHYTIFSSKNVYEGIAKEIRYIRPKFEVVFDECLKHTTKVLITQPFSEFDQISEEAELELYEKMHSKYKFDIRLRHPLESYKKTVNFVPTYESDYMAEEVISGIASSAKVVSVYAINSTVLFTAVEIKNVNCYAVTSQELPFQLPKGYERIRILSDL